MSPDDLRIVVDRAAAGEPLGDRGRELARCLRRYLEQAPEGLSLEAALGLAVTPGQPPWWRRAPLERRNAALRALADEHFGDLDLAGKASAVLADLERYAGGRWRHDRERPEMPSRYVGTKVELLFRAMASRGEIPTSRRQLERILADDTK